METLSQGNNKEFIECECGTEGVHVSMDFDVVQHMDEPKPRITQTYYLAFFGYGHIRKTGWRYKLRHIWHVIKEGTPYKDMVIMTPEEAMKLSNFIRDNLV
jgi:hypothetical protein